MINWVIHTIFAEGVLQVARLLELLDQPPELSYVLLLGDGRITRTRAPLRVVRSASSHLPKLVNAVDPATQQSLLPVMPQFSVRCPRISKESPGRTKRLERLGAAEDLFE